MASIRLDGLPKYAKKSTNKKGEIPTTGGKGEKYTKMASTRGRGAVKNKGVSNNDHVLI